MDQIIRHQPISSTNLASVNGVALVDQWSSLSELLATHLSAGAGTSGGFKLARPQKTADGHTLQWLHDGAAIATRDPVLLGRAAEIRGKISAFAELLKQGSETQQLSGQFLEVLVEGWDQAEIFESDGHVLLVGWGLGDFHRQWSMPQKPLSSPKPVTSEVLRDQPPISPAVPPAANIWNHPWFMPLALLLLAILLGLWSLIPLAPIETSESEPTTSPAPSTHIEQLPEAQKILDELKLWEAKRLENLKNCAKPPEKQTEVPPPTQPPAKPPAQEPKVKPKVEPKKTPVKSETPPTSAPKPAKISGNCPSPDRLSTETPEVILLVDASGSMYAPIGSMSKMDAAKEATHDVVTHMPPDVPVGLVHFDGCHSQRVENVYGPEDRPRLLAKVDDLTPNGGTPLARGVERAGVVASSARPSTLVIVSDGDDSCGGDPCARAREARAKKPNLTINFIFVGDPADTNGLNSAQCVANAGGGKVYRPKDPIAFKQALQKASNQPDMRNCQ